MLRPIRFNEFALLRLTLVSLKLHELHQSLGHPGYARLYHFVRQRNLPFSSEETKGICRNCKTCGG